ncbi:MAG: SDR family oxidoreductase [Alphaproteobacteria bacterium]|nr:SDR family oxidoreductase [Alphaproteobacteria bacterium]
MSQKIALITGGSRGLGRSAVEHLARAGVPVIFTYHRGKADAESVVAAIKKTGGTAATLQLDTANTASFPNFAETLKSVLAEEFDTSRISFLVNNAGSGVYSPLAETTEEQFDTLMNVHFKGVFFLTQQLLPMIADGGRIINVSSGLTRFSLPGYGAYSCMKGAIEVFTRYLAQELGDRGIAVNTLAPGAVETDFGGGVVRDNAEINTMIAAATAMGRVGLPDDIGKAVAALLISDSQWMTGQRIEVSGGQNI